MISTHKRISVLLAVGLIAAAAALAGCSLLPFGQQAAQPAAGPTPASAPATSSMKTTSLTATQSAAVAASLTAAPLSTETEVPSVTGMDAKIALRALKDARLDYVLSWSGDAMAKSRVVVSQQPPAGSTVASGTRVALTASVGKGEGRPVPLFYYGTVESNVWGFRGQGSVTTQVLPMPAHRWLVTAILRMPMKIYVTGEDGERRLIQRNFKRNGVWYTVIYPVKSDDEEHIRFEVVTPNSTWFDVRYAFYTDAQMATFIQAVRSAGKYPSAPGNEVPGVVSVPTAP